MPERFKVLLIEDDPDLCRELSDCFAGTEELHLAKVTDSSEDGFLFIRDETPDAVILDLELHQGSGTGIRFLKEVQTLSLPQKPLILINTHNSSQTIYGIVRNLGADYILYKHQTDYSPRFVAEVLLDMLHGRKAPPPDPQDDPPGQPDETRTPTQRIQTMLNSVRISPRMIGYGYLTEAIEIFADHPIQNVSAVIGERHRKTRSSVERAMQTAIDKAWSIQSIDALSQYYTAYVDPRRGNPTVTEFISYFAMKLREKE